MIGMHHIPLWDALSTMPQNFASMPAPPADSQCRLSEAILAKKRRFPEARSGTAMLTAVRAEECFEISALQAYESKALQKYGSICWNMSRGCPLTHKVANRFQQNQELREQE